MSEEEIGFDDWEKEAEMILKQQVEEPTQEKKEQNHEVQHIKDNPQQQDPLQLHQAELERIKKMSTIDFAKESIKSQSLNGSVQPFSSILITQNHFYELALSLGKRFRSKANDMTERVLPQSQILTFFEQFIQYLYPQLQWGSVQVAREKTRILKKEKKEEEARARKVRQKEMRLKRAFNRVEQKEEQYIRKGENEQDEQSM